MGVDLGLDYCHPLLIYHWPEWGVDLGLDHWHQPAVIESLEASAAPGQIAFEVHLQNSYSMCGPPVSYTEWAGL